MSGKYVGPGNPTHGIASTYRSQAYACRCDECCRAHAETHRAETAKRRAKLQVTGEQPTHGLRGTYTNWGCRCNECSAAHATYLTAAKASRVTRLQADPTIVAHGTNSTYTGWGCRCEPCIAAARQSARARRGAA